MIIVRGINWCVEEEDVAELYDVNGFPTENEYWETIEADIEERKNDLPTNINIEWDENEYPTDDDVIDFLSDYYGWLIDSVDIIVRSDNFTTTIRH